jgi:hypothetical protein
MVGGASGSGRPQPGHSRQCRIFARGRSCFHLLGVTVSAADVRAATDIESALTAFAREPNGGLIVVPSPINLNSRELIIASAARQGLPAIYPFHYYPTSGGLVSYGFDPIEQSGGQRLTLTASCAGQILVNFRCNYRPNTG